MTRPAIPVSLVTGFLGAGKTTLLKRLLEADHGARLGVVVNDFGAINIDAELMREVQGEAQMVRLTNGCICCSVRGDLLETVVQLTAQDDAPDQIIIEASGISDPIQLAQTFSLPELAHIVRLDSILAVADAAEFETLTGGDAELACRQIATADLVLLNKTDLVADAQRASIRARIASLAPEAVVLEVCHCDAPPEILLGLHPRAARHGRAVRDGCEYHDHQSLYEAFSWEQELPLDVKKLKSALDRMPATLLRVKGFVYLAQTPGERGILHRVGRRASLIRGGPWAEVPRTRLVFVGNSGLVRGEIQSLLEDSVASREASDNPASRPRGND